MFKYQGAKYWIDGFKNVKHCHREGYISEEKKTFQEL